MRPIFSPGFGRGFPGVPAALEANPFFRLFFCGGPAGPSPGFARWPPSFFRGLPQKMQEHRTTAPFTRQHARTGPTPLAIYGIPASSGVFCVRGAVFLPIPLAIHSFAVFSPPAVHSPLSILARLLDRVARGRDSRLRVVHISEFS